MHSTDPYSDHSPLRSNLRATLRRLHSHLEGNRHREQAALELFGNWQARWSDSRDVIAQQMEWLNQELSQLKTSAVPVPHLSLLGAGPDDVESEPSGNHDATEIDDDDSETGIISSQPDVWNSAQFPR